MKKVVYTKFGDPEVLEVVESETAKLQKDEVCIEVKSVSLNPLDLKLLSGSQKMLSGKKFPKMIGIDFSGIITEIGNEIKDFKIGDEIFGAVKDPMKEGALAETIVIEATQITLKPKNISFSQAAAMTSVGAPAIKALEEKITLQKGQTVLIYGASGGVGMVAIQVAKKAGAIVTAVSSAKGLAFMKEWGADFVIDYKKEDIRKLNNQYDVILELSGKLSYREANNLMTSTSVFLTPVGAGSMKDLVVGKISSLCSKRKFIPLIAPATTKIRARLAHYAQNGLLIYIGKEYAMDEVNIAYTQLQKKGTIGKVAISI